jgi:hypothetical protein
MENQIAVREQGGAVAESNEAMIARVKGRVQTLQTIYRDIMIKGDPKAGVDGDYGVIPGCGNKPALKKAGAEKLLLGFRVSPTVGENIKIREYDGGHREVTVVCTLTSMTGEVLGEGVGSCSTLESKYRYRNVADFDVQDCAIPKDSKERKNEYRKQGFGMKKVDDQWCWVKYKDEHKTENPDIADQYNTVLKMAKKRALIDAVLTVFGASDLFTQDIDEIEPEKSAAQSSFENAEKLKEAEKTKEDIAAKYRGQEPPVKTYTPAELYQQYKDKAHASGNGDKFDKKADEHLNKIGKSLAECTDADYAGLNAHLINYFKQEKANGAK